MNVSSIATPAGKKLSVFRARKYFSPSNLLTLYNKAQIRPSLEYCSHIWGAAAPTTLSILDAVQRRAIRLIGDPALTCHLQPLSHQRNVLLVTSHSYRYLNGFCSSDLISIIPLLSKLEEHGLSQQLTFSFLRSSGLQSETEGFIMACQDGVFNTLVYHSRVMGVNVPDARCRGCRQAPETLMHLLSACKTYAGTAYVHRHNAALRVLYHHLRHSHGIDETKLRRLWPDYAVSLLVIVIGSLGGMRNTMLSALRAMLD
nr:unnamed protein product [Callosobruchus chinensis]